MTRVTETITRDQAIDMLMDAILLDKLDATVHFYLSSMSGYVLRLNTKHVKDAFWGRCTDINMAGKYRNKFSITQDEIKELINHSDSLGREKRDG